MATPQSSDELKDQGNKAFATKDYDKAIDLYTQAIKLNAQNHLLFSNRSASHAGKQQWQLAADDAKECIRLDPTFVKGYYRLATAQISLRDWDGATATIKQGLNVDPHNSQLSKQLHTVKQSKKAAKKQQTTYGGLMIDSSIAKELQDLQDQFTQTTRESNAVKANITHSQRECRTNEITMSELEKLPTTDTTSIYRSVGKMFVRSSREEVFTQLTDTIESEKKRETDLTKKLEYLERRLKSQQANIEELVSSSRPSTE